MLLNNCKLSDIKELCITCDTLMIIVKQRFCVSDIVTPAYSLAKYNDYKVRLQCQIFITCLNSKKRFSSSNCKMDGQKDLLRISYGTRHLSILDWLRQCVKNAKKRYLVSIDSGTLFRQGTGRY